MELYYLGLADYIFFIATAMCGWVAYLLLSALISDWGTDTADATSRITISIIIFIPISIALYVMHIPDGAYKARVSEIDGFKIGKGTKRNRPLDFSLKGELLEIHLSQYHKVNKHSAWSIYIDKYTSKNTVVTISKMGTVRLFNKASKIKSKIKVEY